MRRLAPAHSALLVLACLAAPRAATSDTPTDAIQLDVTKHVLKNGMRVLLVPRRNAPVVATHLRFDVGGVDDPKGQTGIAHLLEHMMFKGTDTFGTTDAEKEKPIMARLDALWAELDAERARQASPFATAQPDRIRAIEEEIAKVTAEQKPHVVKNELWQAYRRCGGVGLNASTGNDSTQYYVQLPANQLEIWARLEADRISNPVFREFYSERDVVHEERRLRTDTQPRSLFGEAFEATAFTAHPYRNPVVGWSSDIDATVRAEVLDYFKSHYAPNNAIAVLVGDIDVPRTIALMEKHFGPIPAKPAPRRNVTVEPEQKGERRLAMELDAAPALTIGWHVPAAGHDDGYALTVASRVLSGSGGGFGRGRRGGGGGGGSPGRLQKRLVQRDKIALNASAFSRPGKYPGLFTATATPAFGHSLDELENAVLAEIEGLATERPTDEELARVRNAIDAQAIRTLTSNTGIASALAQAEALAGDWRYVDVERARLKAVTADDVARVVRTYLVATNRTVGHLMGTRPAQSRQASSSAGEGQ
jgi:predicted Zn-dependent peptidase